MILARLLWGRDGGVRVPSEHGVDDPRPGAELDLVGGQNTDKPGRIPPAAGVPDRILSGTQPIVAGGHRLAGQDMGCAMFDGSAGKFCICLPDSSGNRHAESQPCSHCEGGK